MDEVMHSKASIKHINKIDYTSQVEVEEQCALRRDLRDQFIGKQDWVSIAVAKKLEEEIEEITRNFVNGIEKHVS